MEGSVGSAVYVFAIASDDDMTIAETNAREPRYRKRMARKPPVYGELLEKRETGKDLTRRVSPKREFPARG
jgi:hypothetical protein